MTAESLTISDAMAQEGYVILNDVLSPSYIERAKAALTEAIEREAEYHGGTDYPDYGMVLLCTLYGEVFSELLGNERFLEPFEAVLGAGCITYAYTSSSMPPKRTNFSRRIHVDSPRLIPGYTTNVGATVLLDDFTEDNGATYFMPRSQARSDAPSDDEFTRNALRVIAPAGSVFFFNARLWHAGGDNTTERWRHALTVNMCRPFMKQRLDIPRAMEEIDLSRTEPRILQKLGIYAQVPASYDEYYVPPDQRKFRQPAE